MRKRQGGDVNWVDGTYSNGLCVSVAGLREVGRVVVQVPGVAEAGAVLRVLGAATVAASSEESSDRSAAQLKWNGVGSR